MKRFWGLIIVVLLTVGCASQTVKEESFYSYDFFRITKENFNSVQEPANTNFDSLKGYYNNLKLLEYENVENGINWLQNDFFIFLTGGPGMTRAQANQQTSFLRSNGNTYLFFEDAEKGSDYLVFLYLEKQ